MALLAFYWSVPRERVKDRLETALSADVTSGQPLAIGMDVQIGELTMKMFTGLGFKASDIVLRTRPINVGEKPARYIIDDVRVRLGLFSTLFGRPSYSFVGARAVGDGRGAGLGQRRRVEGDGRARQAGPQRRAGNSGSRRAGCRSTGPSAASST